MSTVHANLHAQCRKAVARCFGITRLKVKQKNMCTQQNRAASSVTNYTAQYYI